MTNNSKTDLRQRELVKAIARNRAKLARLETQLRSYGDEYVCTVDYTTATKRKRTVKYRIWAHDADTAADTAVERARADRRRDAVWITYSAAVQR